ncbi:MAG: hypothetical protein ACREJQ_06285, partial [bacterium]
QLLFMMPAFAVASYSIVMAMEMDITAGDLWESLRENYLDAVFMGILLLPVIGGMQWVARVAAPTAEMVVGTAIVRGVLGGVIVLVPFYFMMHLVDGKKGTLAAFADGWEALAPRFHLFLLIVLEVSVLLIGAEFAPLIGGFIALLVEVTGVYALASFYYEISGKEAQDEQLMKTNRDISKMPSVWKPGATGRPEEPMGQIEKSETEEPPGQVEKTDPDDSTPKSH